MKKRIVLIIGAGASHDLHPEFGLGSHLIQEISDRVTDRTSPHVRNLSNLLLKLDFDSSICWDFVHHLDEYKNRVSTASIDEFLNEIDTYPEFKAVRTRFKEIGDFAILFHVLGYEKAIKERPIKAEKTWIDILAKFIDEKKIADRINCECELKIITFNYDRNIEHLLYTHDRFKESKTDMLRFLDSSIEHVYGKAGELEWQNQDQHFCYGEDNDNWQKIFKHKDAIRIAYSNRMDPTAEEKVKDWLSNQAIYTEVLTFGFSWDILNYGILRLRELDRRNTRLIANVHPATDDGFVRRRAMFNKIKSVLLKAELDYLSCAEFLEKHLTTAVPRDADFSGNIYIKM